MEVGVIRGFYSSAQSPRQLEEHKPMAMSGLKMLGLISDAASWVSLISIPECHVVLKHLVCMQMSTTFNTRQLLPLDEAWVK